MIATPSSVTAKIQRSAKSKSKIVHIDKLKAFLGKPPKKWTLPNSEVDSDGEIGQTQDSVMYSDEAVSYTHLTLPTKRIV